MKLIFVITHLMFLRGAGKALMAYANKFAEVGSHFSKKFNAKIIILGNKEELPVRSEIAKIIGRNAAVPTVELGVAAAILERATLLICNDGGLMHVGASLDVPMIAIWGGTDVRRGYKDHNKVIIQKKYSCSPCHDPLYKTEPCKSLKCLETIQAEEVIREAEGLLRKLSKI